VLEAAGLAEPRAEERPSRQLTPGFDGHAEVEGRARLVLVDL
jgi:hypothetical protein